MKPVAMVSENYMMNTRIYQMVHLLQRPLLKVYMIPINLVYI